MKHSPRLLTLLLMLLLVAAPCLLPPRAHAFGWPNNNDSIFPPQAAAKPFIDFDGRGFLVHGKRTFIAAGELQYARTPRALWRDRMLRIKRAGYNAVQTYVYWNFHEPREGEFDFAGDKDLDAYLKLAHSLGLYAVVRIGPYVNSEWDTGGLPVWLRFKPGLLPMQDNAPFYAALDPYFARLVPILARNQINHGGPILMVQMENENSAGGGTDLPNAYYKRFLSRMRAGGLQVPLFFSGLNHGDDPAGDSPFDTSQRTSPWFSTEFWTGWIKVYGVEPERGKKLERATWKVIAYGGNGYSQYTFCGGTDFDAWNCDEQGASYDFGAPVGQAGDLRDVYYRMKRAASFATSFPDVIENSLAGAGGDGAGPTDGSIQITNRKGPAGEILFLDNRTGGPVKTQIRTADGAAYPHAGPITLDTGEIMPVVKGYTLAPGVRLTLAAARVLGVDDQGATTTLVIYGKAGEPGELHFTANGAKALDKPSVGNTLAVTATGVSLQTRFPAQTPLSVAFKANGRTIRVLVMSDDLADRTWFLSGGQYIACGPDYVGEAQEHGGVLELSSERRGLPAPASTLPQLLYGPTLAPPMVLAPVATVSTPAASASAPVLGPWQADGSVPQAQPGFDDAGWKSSDQPLPMGADGDIGPYAWYRTRITVPPPTPGAAPPPTQIALSDVGDWAACFINGKHVASSDVRQRYQNPVSSRLSVTLPPGTDTVAFLTAHFGRNKLYNYYGPLDIIDAKGISGPVRLESPPAYTGPLNKFRWQADDRAPDDAAKQAAPDLNADGADWHDATTSTDVFAGRVGWAWFRAVLPDLPGPHRVIRFNSIDDNGDVFLNGRQIAAGVGVNAGKEVSLDAGWRVGKPNVLAVAVQNTAGGGGLLGDITLQGGIAEGRELRGWRMHGGETPPAPGSPAWKPLVGGPTGIPSFFRTTFTVNPPGPTGPHPILRASPLGLSRGSIWLNGHNLGRYPERSPVDGLYLPESMLRAGRNELVIFDEEGNSPAGVRIVVEAAASRTDVVLAPVRPARAASR
jgi:beta-galactosidase